MRSFHIHIPILFFLLFCFAAPATAGVQIYAAASLADAVGEAADTYGRRTGVRATPVLAASATLARQIVAGAPADIFISADERWMDYLATRHLLLGGSRRDMLGNRLVLVVPRRSTAKPLARGSYPLLALLGEKGRLAVGDPAFVPVGFYAKQTLVKLGLWRALAGRLAPAADTRAALAYVAQGNSPLGIVYRTDALGEPRVRILATFPDSSHAPIRYPMALLRHAGPDAQAMACWLEGREAAAIFRKHGFLLLAPDAASRRC